MERTEVAFTVDDGAAWRASPPAKRPIAELFCMPEDPVHPSALPPEKLLARCDMRFLRRSGPGGQHRNKVSTAVVLEHRPSGIQAEASERRSQAENRAAALFRLRMQLALGVRVKRKAGDAPSPLWQSRVRGGRIEIGSTHEHFPAILAEALDVMAEDGFDPKLAAAALGCSVSQLVKLLKKEPRALTQVNQERLRRGQHPLQ